MSLTPGTRLGRYEIKGKLGAGGMAEVFLAEDTELGRRVALKLLPPDTNSDSHARRRLLREARAVATLSHPHICAVHDVGETDGHRFIAMQYLEGETLDQRMKRHRMELLDVIAVATDVVDALADAHAHGIVHRDIKPSNVMLTPRNGAVVLDFGLAKPADASLADEALTESVLSAPGVVLGTIPYMSPEQVRGDVVDGRSDIFSFGAVLYEMLTGHRPFSGSSSAATAAAILSTEPRPLVMSPKAPDELIRIVAKTLRKDPAERYQTAGDLLVDLRAVGQAAGLAAQPEARRTTRVPLMAIVIAAVLAAGGWYAWRSYRTTSAAAQIPQVEALAAQGKPFEAFDLATSIERALPRDPTITRLMQTLAITISVKTEPAGARVFLRRYQPDAAGILPDRELVGSTPIADLRIARGQYVLSIEKDGYAPAERTISGLMLHEGTFYLAPAPVAIDHRLVPVAEMPERMVRVPGGEYRLIAWARPTDRRVRLDDFFIDKYEVTNREYKEFISAGGYLKPEYWTVPFVRDGRPISRDEAIRIFVDRSGLPGPRSWSEQNVPEGKGDHPVTDVSWYEAAAYAAFRGKQLPSVFQWEKAARDGAVASLVNYMPWGVFYPGQSLDHHANLDNQGTVRVTDNDFGMSPFGAYNMAGNVAEWTLNDTSEGLIATGAAWGDPSYLFAQYPMYPAIYSSNKVGFRCAVTRQVQARADTGFIEIDRDVPVHSRSGESDFMKWRALYDYEPVPLDVRVEDVKETGEWRRERITFGVGRGQRAIAYLYLPRNYPRPLQVINFIPGGDVDRGYRSVPESMEDRLSPFIKAGRAVFSVVLSGHMERLRPGGAPRPPVETVEYFEELQGRITDIRRGLDYLATRTELDANRIAFVGLSSGGQIGLILAAVEQRYRTVVLVGSGLPATARSIVSTANPINFAPHIRSMKLMMHGKYDEDTPLKTAGMPLFNLLPQPKKLVTFEGGHVPSSNLAFATIGAWLDETMGPVKR